MKRRSWFIGLATLLLLSICSLFFAHAKLNQRELVAELLQEGLAIQFRSGKYCQSIEDVKLQDWLFDTVDVAYFDVPHRSTPQSLSRLKQLPSLTRVLVRYQGDDYEEFRRNRAEIEKSISLQCAQVKRAIPQVEVLNVRAVGEVSYSR